MLTKGCLVGKKSFKTKYLVYLTKWCMYAPTHTRSVQKNVLLGVSSGCFSVMKLEVPSLLFFTTSILFTFYKKHTYSFHWTTLQSVLGLQSSCCPVHTDQTSHTCASTVPARALWMALATWILPLAARQGGPEPQVEEAAPQGPR